MKLVRGDTVVVIRKGVDATVSVQEYQYLSHVYGMGLKGNKVMEVRITKPVKIEAVAQETKKQRKRKKS